MNIPHTCYLIASSPRSGSQLLVELLTATGLAGFPNEHFNPWHMGDATNFFPNDLLYGPQHIQRLIEQYTTSNGVFGTKAHFLQVVNYYQILQCIREVCIDAKGWETYFHERRIDPLRIVYEDFVADQEGTLQHICEFLEIPIPEDFQMPVSRLQK